MSEYRCEGCGEFFDADSDEAKCGEHARTEYRTDGPPFAQTVGIKPVRCGPITRVEHAPLSEKQQLEALHWANYIGLSEHEWTWTDEQAASMARYCLWARQELDRLETVVAVPAKEFEELRGQFTAMKQRETAVLLAERNGRGQRAAPFEPDYAVHPGETLKEHLAYKTAPYAADRICANEGNAFERISALVAILDGKAPITPEIAKRIEAAFGGPPAEFWLRLQAAYDAARARIERKGAEKERER